jgi:hypothetical protein
MKKISLIFTFLLLSLSFYSTNAYFYSDYYWESINWFINSPSQEDLENIENTRIRNCEKVYLEASRRRDFTEAELLVCSDIFITKMQEELDYKTYMLRNRGIY